VSKANVDLVRSSFEAFGRGDFDQAFDCYDDAVEWQTAEDEPDQHTYIGMPALRRFVAYLAEPWSDRFGPAIEFGELIDCGDWVLAPWSRPMKKRPRRESGAVSRGRSDAYVFFARKFQAVPAL